MADEGPKKPLARRPAAGDARARARPSKAERIQILVRMLANGEYHSRATCIELGSQWSLDWRTVKDNACEAARLLKYDPEELEVERQKMAHNVERIAVLAEAMVNRQTGLPDFHAVLKARELEAKFKGIDISTLPETSQKVPELRVVVVEEPEPAPEPDPVPVEAKPG
jgi:hypothetical protein